jgi:predicted RecB family nuclease
MSSALNDFGYPLSGRAPDQVVLSKSRFIAGVQCLKRLYLQTYAAESEIGADASQQGRLEEGRQVGELARTAFPGGVLVEYGNFATGSILAQTAAIIENASVPAIFEAAFRFRGVFIRVDILQRIPGNRWRLIEVKSSTSCKEHYLYDLALQLYVLSGCGLDVNSACLMHLDRSYVYDGQSHDATKLLTILDLTSEVRAIEEGVPGILAAQRNALVSPTPPSNPAGWPLSHPIRM